jgi:chromosome segregation ATPase
MKRTVRVIIALLVILTIALLGLSLSFASTQSSQLGILPPKIDVEATARAIQLEHRRAEVESAAQERLLNIKAQISQKEQTLSELEQASQAQDAQLGAKLAALQDQIAQYGNDIGQAQALLVRLQQTVRETETNAQDAAATDESQVPTTQPPVQQSLPTVSPQLQTNAAEQAQPPASLESSSPASDEANEHSPDSQQAEDEHDSEAEVHDDDKSDGESDGHDDDDGDKESNGHDDDEGDEESDEHDDD